MIPLQPVINPAIPFVDQIVGGLQPGTTIIVTGCVPSSAEYFQINLACGPVLEPDEVRSPIAFHFNPRFCSRYTARNTFRNGRWGSEESGTGSSVFPFARGEGFEVMILVEHREYKVAVSGKHYVSYVHRIPYQDVNTLQIMRDVEVHKVMMYQGNAGHTMLGFQSGQVTPPGTLVPQAVYDLMVPFEHPVPGGMAPGRNIYITGRSTAHPNRFDVDLFFGGQYGRAGDVAFHFNPRFEARDVVRNSNIGGGWGREECDKPFFPFEPGHSFDLKIVCEIDKFVVFVNGDYFCDYVHRLAYSQATHIRMTGDVTVASLIFG